MSKEIKRILIVDDNESIHQDFKKVLRGKENKLRDLEAELFGDDEEFASEEDSMPVIYQIDDAFQGEEAIWMVEKAEKEGKPYSVIFMDVRMPPGIDGIQAVAEIWRRFPDKELVLCTAYSDYSWKKMLEKIGITDKLQFIRKPFDMVSVQQLALSLTKKYELNQQAKRYIKQLERENRDKEEAQQKLARLNAELEERIENRTAQIQKANEELKTAMDELKRTQAQLVANEKMAALGGLVAGVAHEINTPVGIGVTAASHLMEASKDLNQRFEDQSMKRSDLSDFLNTCRESTEMIMSNLTRASELIQSFKKVAVDQASEECREFLIGEYIGEVLLSLRPKLKQTNLDLRVECDENLKINSYPGCFGQVISNLVMNSVIHAFIPGESGKILIKVQKQDDQVLLSYKDNGSGMAKEVKDKIFDPFFTTKRSKGGSGLGLHIVYNIATQTFGGKISCTSAPGKGTEFTILIPSGGTNGH